MLLLIIAQNAANCYLSLYCRGSRLVRFFIIHSRSDFNSCLVVERYAGFGKSEDVLFAMPCLLLRRISEQSRAPVFCRLWQHLQLEININLMAKWIFQIQKVQLLLSKIMPSKTSLRKKEEMINLAMITNWIYTCMVNRVCCTYLL